MDCVKCSAMEYFEGLEGYVGTDYGDKIEFYATSLAVMDELAEWNYVERRASSKIAAMVCNGCGACAGTGVLGRPDVARLVEKVGGLFRSIPLVCPGK